jgi:hypothetical protein
MTGRFPQMSFLVWRLGTKERKAKSGLIALLGGAKAVLHLLHLGHMRPRRMRVFSAKPQAEKA